MIYRAILKSTPTEIKSPPSINTPHKENVTPREITLSPHLTP